MRVKNEVLAPMITFITVALIFSILGSIFDGGTYIIISILLGCCLTLFSGYVLGKEK